VRWIALLVCVVSCEKGTPEERPKPVPPPVADAAMPPDAMVFTGDVDKICVTTKVFLDRLIPCASRSATFLREVQRDLVTAPPDALLSARENAAAGCANLSVNFDGQLEGVLPECRLTNDERATAEAFLVAYYGRRTKPRPTGDATIDKNLAELAAARDALCACRDEDCQRAADKGVTAAVKPIPREMTAAMDDGVAISDEVSRCTERIQNAAAKARNLE
jgi:hypothetical protein